MIDGVSEVCCVSMVVREIGLAVEMERLARRGTSTRACAGGALHRVRSGICIARGSGACGIGSASGGAGGPLAGCGFAGGCGASCGSAGG